MSRTAIDDIEIDGYELVRETAIKPAANDAGAQYDETPLQRRLENWRKTVRMTTSEPNSYCAFWAKEYVALRNMQHEKLAQALQIVAVDSPLQRIDTDVLDGWLVEAAVRTLMVFEEKQLLRFTYVFNYPPNWIRAKLGLRERAVRLVHARAIENLTQVLDKLDEPVKIRLNNLHAGIPRL